MDNDARPPEAGPTDQFRKSERDVLDHVQKGEAIANIAPVQSTKRRRSPQKPNYLTPEDALWHIVGMDKSTEGPNDVSTNKRKYLAKAYLHERM